MKLHNLQVIKMIYLNDETTILLINQVRIQINR